MAHQDRKHYSLISEPSSGGPILPRARLSRQVQAQLGQRLRAFYEALALSEQSVPDRFIEIINRLDEGLSEGQERHS